METVSLYEAKTQLSGLVDRAAAGEEITISKNGVPKAKLVPLPDAQERRRPARALGLTHLASDFDAVDMDIVQLFTGPD